MSKSVLIIDTPERCIDCDCFYSDDLDYWVCYPTWEEKDKYAREQTFSPFTDRMPNCPLVPLEKVCKMAIEAHKEEKMKTRKKNTKICGNCFYKFDIEENTKVFISYSDWFEDEAKGGDTYKWRYEFHRVQCPHCGSFVLKDYTTERKEDSE